MLQMVGNQRQLRLHDGLIVVSYCLGKIFPGLRLKAHRTRHFRCCSWTRNAHGDVVVVACDAPQPIGGGRFPVKFYLTAMLFIIFDIETIFLYPWAVSFEALGLFGFVEMVLFIVTVFIAYTYVWRRGGLNWD